MGFHPPPPAHGFTERMAKKSQTLCSVLTEVAEGCVARRRLSAAFFTLTFFRAIPAAPGLPAWDGLPRSHAGPVRDRRDSAHPNSNIPPSSHTPRSRQTARRRPPPWPTAKPALAWHQTLAVTCAGRPLPGTLPRIPDTPCPPPT